jgi:hypothetical protein
MENVAIRDIRLALDRDGYFVAQVPSRGEHAGSFLLDLARALGELYVPPECDPEAPLIRTAPTARRRASPFDRPESIGWHGDFATHVDRPELSLVYVTRSDPRGADFGAWRLASVSDVLNAMAATAGGREAIEYLSATPVPFRYTDDDSSESLLVLEPRSNGRIGLRFFSPSIWRGCLATYGQVPDQVVSAVAEVGRAADAVARQVPTQEGSLLITTNWFALHDRTQQSLSRTRARREALLCFVKHRS